MKNGPETTGLILAVNDPDNVSGGALGYVPPIATPEGVQYTVAAGGSPIAPIGVAGAGEGMGSEEPALAVRAAGYSWQFDDYTSREFTSAFFGLPFLDFGPSLSFYGLLTNSAVYGYDIDTDDGSVMGVVALASPPSIASGMQALATLSELYGFNGDSWVRLAMAASETMGNTEAGQALLVQQPGEWTLTDAPAVNTAATATRTAFPGGRHILRSICADLTAVAAIVAPLTLVVRDGATGVGTILWQRRLTSPAGETKSIELSGLNIVGSENTDMTVEFTAAPGATNFQTISATGIEATAT